MFSLMVDSAGRLILAVDGGIIIKAPTEPGQVIAPNPENPSLPLTDDEGNIITYTDDV